MPTFLSLLKNRKLFVTFLLAFSSSLPLPLTTGTLDTWLADKNVSLKTIGFFSLVGLPYTLKFLWAPFLDRYMPPFLNRRTGWIVITQGLLILGISLMGFIDPVQQPFYLAGAALCVAFFSASQDIVIDAYRADLLGPGELGPGAGITVTGLRLALIVSGGMAVLLADYLPWGVVYQLMAGLMLIGVLAAIFAPAPEIKVLPPKSLKDAVIDPFVSYFKLKHAVAILFFILLYKLGDVVAGKMTSPFLIKMGYSKTAIGSLNKTLGMAMTIFGALAGGVTVTRIGIWKSLWFFGILQALSNFCFVAIAKNGPSLVLLAASISVENLCGGLGTAAYMAFLMSLCDKHFTATQYALLTSIMAITRIFLGPLSGYLAENLSWSTYFTVSAAFAIPGMLLLLCFKELAAPQIDEPARTN